LRFSFRNVFPYSLTDIDFNTSSADNIIWIGDGTNNESITNGTTLTLVGSGGTIVSYSTSTNTATITTNLSGYSLTTHNHSGVYQPAGTYLTVETDPIFTAWDKDYADLSNKPTLGTAAALDVGTTANKVVQLGPDGKLLALDGSNLTNVISSGAAPSIPYSVISAKTDSNGYANFITRIINP
jgi:hypothetical protein